MFLAGLRYNSRVASPSVPPARPRRPAGLVREAWLITRNDLTMESRGAEVTVTSGFFAVLVVVLASLGTLVEKGRSQSLCAGVIWMSVAFATVLSVARSWAREREGGALDGLLTTRAQPAAIFLGKVLSLALFLGVIELLVIPLAALFFSVDLLDVALGLGALVLAVTPGLAATGTLFGAMTARTSVRDLVLSIVLFPLLSPVLLTAIGATRALVLGTPWVELGGFFRLLLIYDLGFLGLGTALFGVLVDD